MLVVPGLMWIGSWLDVHPGEVAPTRTIWYLVDPLPRDYGDVEGDGAAGIRDPPDLGLGAGDDVARRAPLFGRTSHEALAVRVQQVSASRMPPR